MTVASAEQVSEALQLALRVVNARGDRPVDPRAWRALLVYAPYWRLMEAALAPPP
jgi:hypothetical protein